MGEPLYRRAAGGPPRRASFSPATLRLVLSDINYQSRIDKVRALFRARTSFTFSEPADYGAS